MVTFAVFLGTAELHMGQPGKWEGTVKVLVIEDDPQITESLSLAFETRWPEARLVSTPSGERGVELVNSQAPDVMVLDLGLPDISGFEVLKRVRSFSRIPIVILTASRKDEDRVRGLELGADDYVVKPFSPLEFLERVKSLVRGPGEFSR
jgi:two-component system KDP operon response regulator KdpE